MKVARKALALAIFACLPFSAQADEPAFSEAPRTRVMKRTMAVRSVPSQPLLVPDCAETMNVTLLECAPRIYVRGDDLATLNQLNAVPTRVTRPYPYLFSW
jgi:hypothetical protein